MHPIIQRIIDNKLSDFAGSRVAGQVEVTDELVNEVLQLSLKALTMPKTSTDKQEEEATVTNVEAMPPISELLQAVTFDQLNYRTEKGKTIVDLEASIPA